jgi:AcrR family transcriptional regulator
MAKVDIARRAQIGQEKRARTRAALVAAAKSFFALRSIESVTIDEIVVEAGLAKGTFYTHFEDLDALTAAEASERRRWGWFWWPLRTAGAMDSDA